jgi:hypothetical protein
MPNIRGVVEITWLRQRKLPDQSVAAGQDAHLPSQSRSCLATERERETFKCLAESLRAAGIRRNCIRQPLGKNPLAATKCSAEESSSVENHLNRDAVPRHIGEPAFIATMNACG